MWHIGDEAKERAEKMAEAAEKEKAKTPEERAEIERKEDAGGGILDELLETPELEEIKQAAEELTDGAAEQPESLTAGGGADRGAGSTGEGAGGADGRGRKTPEI